MSAERTFYAAEDGWISNIVIYPAAGFFAQAPGGNSMLEEPSLCSRESLYTKAYALKARERIQRCLLPLSRICLWRYQMGWMARCAFVCLVNFCLCLCCAGVAADRNTAWRSGGFPTPQTGFFVPGQEKKNFRRDQWGIRWCVKTIYSRSFPTHGGLPQAGVLAFVAKLTCWVGPARTCFGRRTGWG